MRSLDVQQVKSVWTDRGQTFVATAVRDRFRSHSVDNFVFVFQCGDDDVGGSSELFPISQVKLDGSVSEIAFTPERMAVSYSSKDYGAHVQVFLRSEDFAVQENVIIPEVNSFVSIMSSATSLYILAKENSSDTYLMLYEMADGDEEFTEHCLIEEMSSVIGLQCLMRDNHVILWSGEGDYLTVFDHIAGETLWRHDHDKSDYRMSCHEKLINCTMIAVCLLPKDFGKSNSLIMLYDLSSGEDVYSLECPSDRNSHSLFNCAMSEELLVACYKDEFDGDSVIKVLDIKNKVVRTVIHDYLFVNSLDLVSGSVDLALVSLHNARESRGSDGTFGQLCVLDLSKETLRECFKKPRKFWEVALMSETRSWRKYASVLPSSSRGGDFLCVTRRGQDRTVVSKVDLEELKIF